MLDFWVGFLCVLFFILNCIFLFSSALLRCSQHNCKFKVYKVLV